METQLELSYDFESCSKFPLWMIFKYLHVLETVSCLCRRSEFIGAFLKVIIYSVVLCWNLCTPCVCTHAWECVCMWARYAWVCLFYVWAFVGSISAHMCFFSGAWTLLFPTDKEAFCKGKIFMFESCKNLIQGATSIPSSMYYS